MRKSFASVLMPHRTASCQAADPLSRRQGDPDWRRGRLGLPDRRSRCAPRCTCRTRRRSSSPTPTAAKIVGEIPDTAGVHGIALAPDLGRGFTSNGRANTSTIVDLKTLKPLGTVATGANPDSIRYCRAQGSLDVQSHGKVGDRVRRAEREGHRDDRCRRRARRGGRGRRREPHLREHRGQGAIAVSTRQAHPGGHLADRPAAKDRRDWPSTRRTHLLLSACSNGKMAVVDSQSGKVVTTAKIGARSDGAAFDPQTGHIFSSNGEGSLYRRHASGNTVTIVQTLMTQASGRTIALDPIATVYIPAATMGAAAAGQRPQPVPDSFRVLVVGMAKP